MADFAKIPVLERLESRAKAWDIHDGDMYFESSAMDLNKCDQALPKKCLFMQKCMDTRHNLLDFAQFCDFMDSRARQAEALANDLRDYKAFASGCEGFNHTPEGRSLLANFGERYIMAMYGADESRRQSRFEAHAYNRSERPYERCRASVEIMAGEVTSATIDGTCFPPAIDELESDLRSFSDEWHKLFDTEYKAFCDSDGKHPMEIGFEGGKGQMAQIYSDWMACRYVAEVAGRGLFYDRTCMAHEYAEDEVLGNLTVNSCPDLLAMYLNNVEWCCNNWHNQIGFGQDAGYACGLDGRKILKLVDSEFSSFGPVNTKSRDMSDISAACDDISSSSETCDYDCDVSV